MSLNDQLAALFKANPGVWLDGRRLAEVGGYAGWRTRVSDLRIARHMDIENRWRTVRGPDRIFRITEYRYLPRVEPEQLPLIERERISA